MAGPQPGSPELKAKDKTPNSIHRVDPNTISPESIAGDKTPDRVTLADLGTVSSVSIPRDKTPDSVTLADPKTISPVSIAGDKTPDRVTLADPGTVPPVLISNEKTTDPMPDIMTTSEFQDQNTPPYPKSIMKKDTKYDKIEKEYELVPPDGGWGWAIMLATALSNLILIPISQTFGLLYRDTFTDLGMSATDSSVIVNVNSAFGMLLGLFHGILLNQFGYRKIAITGAIVTFLGLFLTSFGNSFTSFLIYYGLISSFGINIIPPSFSLALNSYFLRLKGRAMGFASTIMAIGPILIPPLISQLMDLYGVQGTSLILSALALHTLLGAFLLQPIKWHLVKREIGPEEAKAIAINEEYYKETFTEEMGTRRSLFESARESRKMGRRIRTVTSMSSINHDMDSTSIYGLETHMYNSEGKFKNRSFVIENTNQMSRQTDGPPTSDQKVFWFSGASIASGNSVRLIDEKMYEPLHEADEEEETEMKMKNITLMEDVTVLLDDDTKNNVPENVERKPSKNDFQSVNSIDSLRDMLQRGFFHRLMRRIFVALDLGLLQDPIYVNIMLGMSFAICAENNFSLVTPFILGDLGFSNDRIAAVMSTLAAADLVLRFLSPFFADYMGYSSRTMYLISLCMLVTARTRASVNISINTQFSSSRAPVNVTMTDPITNDLVLGNDEDIVGSPGSREEEYALPHFIKQYELSPELWNPTNPLYSKKAARNSAIDLLIPILMRINLGANKREDARFRGSTGSPDGLSSIFNSELTIIGGHIFKHVILDWTAAIAVRKPFGSLIFFRTFESVLIVSIGLGVAKGVRTVYMALVIPSYVPIERLAAASGLQMVVNGVFLLVFGPFLGKLYAESPSVQQGLKPQPSPSPFHRQTRQGNTDEYSRVPSDQGFIRDISGSYNLAIVAINSLTALTITMWLIEIIIVACRDRKKKKTNT
ncbi:unnamed protein product [Timema podura]|uniref:Monocarboxylate transporter n=1 Tax=Timema podura TaxID=61482 RepID=A0ABN7NHQ8_TIMPD|nr:unnamed protein product [Timema podura]